MRIQLNDLVLFIIATLFSGFPRILSDIFMNLLYRSSKGTLDTLLANIEYFLILSNDDSFSDCVVILCVVVNKWAGACISDYSHLCLNESLTRTHIPVLEPGDQVYIEIGLLVYHVDELVPTACHSGNVYRLACVYDLVHDVLVLIERCTHPQIVLVIFDGVLIGERH